MPSGRLSGTNGVVADENEKTLSAIAVGTAGAVGELFFCTLVKHLAGAMRTNHAFVAEFRPPATVRTLARWSNGEPAPNIEFNLIGHPCQEVIDGGFCFYPSGVESKYAESSPGIQSYLGVPLLARDGGILGHLCVFDESPLRDEPRTLEVLQIFAMRAAAELDRIRLEKSLHVKQEQLQDLFEEAPVAYVYEHMDTRFVRANRAARTILGITPAEVTRTIGSSLIAGPSEIQDQLVAALKRIGAGDVDSRVVELRRSDNGERIWIQRWSRPSDDGTHTRTMFLDVTENVLAEQEQARLKAQNLYLKEEIQSEHNFEEIIGASTSLLQVMEKVRRVAPTGASVLITGESGTGKELIARALHSASARSDKPFIKVNCAALPVGLVESELFGHERGAFSGAIQRRIGRFELAHTGTIFLDEIGDVPMDVQVKLLRVLQEHEINRIGSSKPIATDVRVLAASNRDLHKSMADGEFRSDLFYRLSVFPIDLPPLRERVGDIELLAHFFLQKHGPRIGRRIETIDADSMRRLVLYTWPGNIRELENVIERALILSDNPILKIDLDVMPDNSVGSTPEKIPQQIALAAKTKDSQDLDSIQREHILRVLHQADWAIEGSRGAAVRLGMKPGTLRHRMKKLRITRKESS